MSQNGTYTVVDEKPGCALARDGVIVQVSESNSNEIHGIKLVPPRDPREGKDGVGGFTFTLIVLNTLSLHQPR